MVKDDAGALGKRQNSGDGVDDYKSKLFEASMNSSQTQRVKKKLPRSGKRYFGVGSKIGGGSNSQRSNMLVPMSDAASMNGLDPLDE